MRGFIESGVMAALVFALLGSSVRADEPAGQVPLILRDIGFDQRLGERLPLDTQFRDEAGRTVRLGQYFGQKPVILSVVYYECPMLCTLTLNGLVSALDTLSFDVGREFEVVTVSFNSRETPELAAAKKAAYLKRYRRAGAEAGWHFLTGDEKAVQALTKSVGFRYKWDARTAQFAHPAGLVVATPQGVIARYLYGVEYTPKDVRLALVEASENKVGTRLDRMALYCYKYDPTSGKYGAAVMRLVRVAAALTVLGLGGLVFVMRRRESQGALREMSG
jgi:protein SCO1/2